MEVGQRIGPFEIERELGSGAMGTVYRARVTDTGQVVALKVIAFGLAGNESARKRFEREAAILKQLRHRHIVRLVATGQWRKTPFFAMEYVDGESLDRAQARRGRFSWEEVVRIGIQLCDALQHAHERGIIHRDIKPSNIMVLRDGTVKLTDFGIAKDIDVTALTGANNTIGTAAYMSPEQCKGEKDITGKSDLYSLGVVFYELITGEKPFKAESTVDMFLAHVSGSFVRPSRLVLELPPWLDTLICQLLEKKPEHRPLDAAMTKRALEEVLEKVETQRSAGAEVAAAKVADRDRYRGTMADETDREAARTLRAAARKRKVKKKRTPFYQQVWFQVVAIALFLGGMGFLIYEATRPESAEAMARVVDARLKEIDGDVQSIDRALQAVNSYLAVYGDRDSEETRRMAALRGQLSVDRREVVLHNCFRRNIAPEIGYDEASWELTRSALEAEAAGDLRRARQNWEKIAAEGPAEGEWKGVAEKKLARLGQVEVRQKELADRLRQARIDEVPPGYEAEPEKLAVDAVRFEEYQDPRRALQRWEEVRKQTERDLSRRDWFLLAAGKVRELKDRLPEEDPEQELRDRLAQIDKALALARAWKDESGGVPRRNARNICRDLRDLYSGDPSPEVAQKAKEAEALLAEMTSGS